MLGDEIIHSVFDEVKENLAKAFIAKQIIECATKKYY